MNIFKNKYRVVKDNYGGFEVQIKRWYFPFYVQLAINTNLSVRQANLLIEIHKKYKVVYDVGLWGYIDRYMTES